MRNTFTITIQGNQGIEPKASFVVSGNKARRIIEILEPNIMQRPIVFSKKFYICRPPEKVLEILGDN